MLSSENKNQLSPPSSDPLAALPVLDMSETERYEPRVKKGSPRGLVMISCIATGNQRLWWGRFPKERQIFDRFSWLFVRTGGDTSS